MEAHRTILGLEITVQNRHCPGRCLGGSARAALRQAEHVCAHVRLVNAIMAAVQRHDQLAKYAPHETLLSSLALVLQVLYDSTEIAVAAILHVKMQVLAEFEMLAVVVGDDVGVSEVREDLELGMQLLALLLGHAEVRDFLAAHDEAVGLAAHLADDAEGAMAFCAEMCCQQPELPAAKRWAAALGLTNLLQRLVLVLGRHGGRVDLGPGGVDEGSCRRRRLVTHPWNHEAPSDRRGEAGGRVAKARHSSSSRQA